MTLFDFMEKEDGETAGMNVENTVENEPENEDKDELPSAEEIDEILAEIDGKDGARKYPENVDMETGEILPVRARSAPHSARDFRRRNGIEVTYENMRYQTYPETDFGNHSASRRTEFSTTRRTRKILFIPYHGTPRTHQNHRCGEARPQEVVLQASRNTRTLFVKMLC